MGFGTKTAQETVDTFFGNAIANNHVTLAEHALRATPAPTEFKEDSYTLIETLRNRHIDAARWLIKHGSMIDAGVISAISFFSKRDVDDFDILELLTACLSSKNNLEVEGLTYSRRNKSNWLVNMISSPSPLAVDYVNSLFEFIDFTGMAARDCIDLITHASFDDESALLSFFERILADDEKASDIASYFLLTEDKEKAKVLTALLSKGAIKTLDLLIKNDIILTEHFKTLAECDADLHQLTTTKSLELIKSHTGQGIPLLSKYSIGRYLELSRLQRTPEEMELEMPIILSFVAPLEFLGSFNEFAQQLIENKYLNLLPLYIETAKSYEHISEHYNCNLINLLLSEKLDTHSAEQILSNSTILEKLKEEHDKLLDHGTYHDFRYSVFTKAKPFVLECISNAMNFKKEFVEKIVIEIATDTSEEDRDSKIENALINLKFLKENHSEGFMMAKENITLNQYPYYNYTFKKAITGLNNKRTTTIRAFHYSALCLFATKDDVIEYLNSSRKRSEVTDSIIHSITTPMELLSSTGLSKKAKAFTIEMMT